MSHKTLHSVIARLKAPLHTLFLQDASTRTPSINYPPNPTQIDTIPAELLFPELENIIWITFSTVILWLGMLCYASIIRQRCLDYQWLGICIFSLCMWSWVYVETWYLSDATYLKWGILEFVCLCWLAKGRLFYGRYRYEPKPLISPEQQMDRRSHADAPVITQYLAVDVAAVDSAELKGGIRIRSLPTRLVQPSLEKASHVAVLSWRWDFEHDAFQEPSRNIACAIRYAKRKGIRYLFIDIISLDQNLPAQELIPQVALFGTLYETIPVVAAYEDQRLRFSDVVFRPWIHSELKCMLRNPHEIVYVGHGTYQKMSTMEWLDQFLLYTEFKDGLLQYAWASPPATPVLQILNGRNRMADIHDFKFIYPMLAEPLIAAEKLDRNDYLLTVALIATASMYGRSQRLLVEPTFTMLSYKKFKILSSLREEHSEGRTFSSHDEAHEIYWEGVKLATLQYHEEFFQPDSMTLYTPRLAYDLERHIFTMLGLSQEAYLRFMANEQKRRAFMLGEQVHELHVQGEKDLSESYVNVVTMKV